MHYKFPGVNIIYPGCVIIFLDSVYSVPGSILWVNSIQRSGEGDGFADVVQAADPGYGSLDDAHAEDGVARHGWIVNCRVRALRECPP
jgi:hypothetical protein